MLHSSFPGNEWVTILELETGKLITEPLKKGVKSIVPAPDSQTVIVLHDKADGVPVQGEPLEDFIDKSWGYSVLHLDEGFAKLQLTNSRPGEIATTPDGALGFVLVADDSGVSHYVDRVDLRGLFVTSLALGSPPQHAVHIPAGERMAISQDHPIGRITFIGTDDGSSETVTGFELNGLIE